VATKDTHGAIQYAGSVLHESDHCTFHCSKRPAGLKAPGSAVLWEPPCSSPGA
jgi:hypothetical protein